MGVPFAILRQRLIPDPNPVGMDANIALFGLAMMLLGLFNLVFFRVYYRDVRKVGMAFLGSSGAVFVFICLVETGAHVLPFMRDMLDTPDPMYLPQKLLTLLAGLMIWALLTLAACRRAERDFEKQDL